MRPTSVCCCLWRNTKLQELHRRPTDIGQACVVQTVGLETCSYQTCMMQHFYRLIQHFMFFVNLYDTSQCYFISLLLVHEVKKNWYWMWVYRPNIMTSSFKSNMKTETLHKKCTIFPLIHSWFPFQWFYLERHFMAENILWNIWHLISLLPHANKNTLGGMGYLKPDVSNTQQPTGHCVTSC